MKPLTAEEIAELRKLYAYAVEGGSTAAGIEFDRTMADAWPRLLEEVERSRALLSGLEWEGADRDGNARCPECHAEPTWVEDSGGAGDGYRGTHTPDCELAALITP